MFARAPPLSLAHRRSAALPISESKAMRKTSRKTHSQAGIAIKCLVSFKKFGFVLPKRAGRARNSMFD